MDPNVILFLAALLVVAGLVGTVVPVLPGVLLVFGGLLLAAWAEGFTRVGAAGMTVIAILAALGVAADFLATIVGVRRVGASRRALAGAALGALVGIFLGIPGMLLGPFIGAVAGELWARGGLVQAGKVGIGTWLGLAAAAIAKLVIALAMVAAFLAFRIAGA